MWAAFLTAGMFAVSAICGHRTATRIGGIEANFWRICLATVFLTLWAVTFGGPIDVPSLPWFLLSGLLGIGLGDTAYFQALPRLGSRRTALISQCLTPLFAALIEWIWLGAALTWAEVGCIGIILGGVAIALAPCDRVNLNRGQWTFGIVAAAIGAFGGALGVVYSRKGFAVAHAASGHFPDAGTSGYVRVLGGILVPTVILLAMKWRSARAHGPAFEEQTLQVSKDKWRVIWPWVLGNSLAGQTLGVTCMQIALAHTPAAIVTSITATTPLILLPMTRWLDGEKISARSLAGALVGVGGVIGLVLVRAGH
jgi:drug/metabolite transporter (DMT)-like permease